MEKETVASRAERIHFFLPKIMENLFFGTRQKLEYPDITITQIRTLRILVENDNCTMGKLSDCAFLTLGTMTTTVNHLVKNKLVKRIRSTQDRRLVRVQLTDYGKEIIQEHQQDARNN